MRGIFYLGISLSLSSVVSSFRKRRNNILIQCLIHLQVREKSQWENITSKERRVKNSEALFTSVLFLDYIKTRSETHMSTHSNTALKMNHLGSWRG